MNDRMKIATSVMTGLARHDDSLGANQAARIALDWADALIEADKVDKKPSKPQVLAVHETSVLVIPTNKFNGQGETFAVTDAMVHQWKEAFPGVDVMAEILVAKTWCMDNPTKRKTLSGMRKFLGSWLTRAQNKGGSRAGVQSSRSQSLEESLTDTSWAD